MIKYNCNKDKEKEVIKMTETYDYIEALIEDIKQYLEDNDINKNNVDEDELNDKLFNEDTVTGNGSGSYTFNTEQAKQNLIGNEDIVRNMIEEGFATPEGVMDWFLDGNYEAIDVAIRCYLLDQAISEVLD